MVVVSEIWTAERSERSEIWAACVIFMSSSSEFSISTETINCSPVKPDDFGFWQFFLKWSPADCIFLIFPNVQTPSRIVKALQLSTLLVRAAKHFLAQSTGVTSPRWEKNMHLWIRWQVSQTSWTWGYPTIPCVALSASQLEPCEGQIEYVTHNTLLVILIFSFWSFLIWNWKPVDSIFASDYHLIEGDIPKCKRDQPWRKLTADCDKRK